MKLVQKQPLTAGVLMLDTHFPRVLGDIGCAQTFKAPPLYVTVDGAIVSQIVSGKPIDNDLVQTFLRLAQKLERDGADFITTSCGFLSSIQLQLEDAVSIPVISSSLLLLETLSTPAYKSPGQLVSVLTFDADELTTRHLPGAERVVATLRGIPEHHELKQVVKSDSHSLDVEKVSAQTAEWIRSIIQELPDVSLFVIECTNLVPYRAIIEEISQRPVYDLFDAIRLVTGVDRAMLVREPFRPVSVL